MVASGGGGGVRCMCPRAALGWLRSSALDGCWTGPEGPPSSRCSSYVRPLVCRAALLRAHHRHQPAPFVGAWQPHHVHPRQPACLNVRHQQRDVVQSAQAMPRCGLIPNTPGHDRVRALWQRAPVPTSNAADEMPRVTDAGGRLRFLRDEVRVLPLRRAGLRSVERDCGTAKQERLQATLFVVDRRKRLLKIAAVPVREVLPGQARGAAPRAWQQSVRTVTLRLAIPTAWACNTPETVMPPLKGTITSPSFGMGGAGNEFTCCLSSASIPRTWVPGRG